MAATSVLRTARFRRRLGTRDQIAARLRRTTVTLLYALALLQFVRYYVKSTEFYLNMQAYLTGHERLPFQERILPIFLLSPMYHSTWFMQHFAHANGAFTPQKGPFYVLSLAALAIAAIFAQRLYSRLTRTNSLEALVFPLFLLVVMWTYSIHSEANYSYPYDFLSLAFFTAGLYYIYTRRFLYLLVVMLAGTLNRETTLFLIGIYVLDAATTGVAEGGLWNRFRLRQVPWARVVLLSVIWLSIKVTLAHLFQQNDRSEDFLRIQFNLARLYPRLLPAMLNICGYSVPLVLLFMGKLQPVRFRNYLFILIPWFAVMVCAGVLVETRIYGELCGLSAVACILILETHAHQKSISELLPVTELLQPEIAA